jgi:hypothetical protein
MYKGIIVENSLNDTSVLDNLKVEKSWVDGSWKLHSVFISENQILKLSQSLKDGPWYTHFWIPRKTSIKVVFRNKVFEIDSQDKTTWENVIAYGQSLNIPKEQLDFPISE